MKKIACLALILALTLSFNNFAFAVGSGGFENASFTPRSIAESNAVVAQADEPGAISYNPAGITQLKGLQIQPSVTLISIFTRHSNNNDTDYSAGKVIPIPTAYMTVNPGFLNDRLVLGVGSDSPFGLANQYSSTAPNAHYPGSTNSLKMYTIKPVASFKINEKISIGGGPVYYRVFDFGGVLAYPNKALGGPFSDGLLRANLQGNTWGWQMGVLAKPTPKHQFGFYFRSPVTVRTHGLIKVENATVGGNFETGGNAKLDLPLNFTWAYAYKPNEKTTVETDLGFTRWSAHKRLFINADPVNSSDDALLAAVGKSDKNYKDVFSLHLGGNRKVTKKLTLRGGGLFYWSPVTEAHFTPAVPDSNSLAISAGASYDLGKYLTFDVAYFSRFWLRRHIDNDISESIGGSVDGSYFSYGQEIFVGLTYKWESFLSGTKKDKEVNAPIYVKN